MVFHKRGGKEAYSCDPMDQLDPTHSVTLCSQVRIISFLHGSNSWGGKEKNEIGWKNNEEENVIFHGLIGVKIKRKENKNNWSFPPSSLPNCKENRMEYAIKKKIITLLHFSTISLF